MNDVLYMEALTVLFMTVFTGRTLIKESHSLREYSAVKYINNDTM
jgi:hypothetical protein